MTYTQISDYFNTLCKEYDTKKGGVSDLLNWVRNLLEKELIDKSPVPCDLFNYNGTHLWYVTSKDGGVFSVEPPFKADPITRSTADLKYAHYGEDVDDPDIVIDVFEVKDMSLLFINEVYGFKVFGARSPGPYKDPSSP